MFKVEIIVDDNKLPKALMALDGLGYELQVHPIHTDGALSDKVMRPRQARQPKQVKVKVLDYLRAHLANRGAAVSAKDIIAGTDLPKDIAHGKQIYNAVHQLILKGIMRRGAENGHYTINPAQL